MNWLFWIGVLTLTCLAWMRVAPSSVAKWHDASIKTSAPKRLGYLTAVKIRGSAAEMLGALDAIIRETPRTSVLAGQVSEGKITYVTRSRILGAPDYTTVLVERSGGTNQMTIYGRLRFGIADQGVNRRRIKRWMQALEAVED